MNYTMSAEWAPHSAVWLAWPHNPNDWPGKFAPIPLVYAEIIRHLTQKTKVKLLVRHTRDRKKAQGLLELAHVDMSQVEFFEIPTNRIWLRDSGPIFVKDDKTKTMLDWRFNAWAKYPNHRLDDKLPQRIELVNQLARIQPFHKGKRVVLEGGSIEVNGAGVLLTTEECLLSDIQCRNPGFSREDYEEVFAQYLGIHQVIWLNEGIVGDDTHGHVDDLARFIDEDTIVTIVEHNKNDDNYARLQDSLKRLKAARNSSGKPFTIIELPMPRALIFENTRLPASYANFLISNGQVLVPTFNDANDRIALNIMAEAMQGYEIIGIHSVDLVWGFGTLHCLSQQEPA